MLIHARPGIPAIAPALASLGFPGLGTRTPAPEWGRMPTENRPYAKRAPRALLGAPAVLAAAVRGRAPAGPK
jgi:ABC-type dipeptide/oligopeptide/nickel transport system permease subunit